MRALCPETAKHTRGVYDPGYFSQIGIPTYSPANYAELVYWLDLLVKEKRGPRAIRYARGEETPALAALGCSGRLYDPILTHDGAKVALVSYGAESEETLAAADLLKQQGVLADVWKLVQIFPLPDNLCEELGTYSTILFAEEAVRTGGDRAAAWLCAAAARMEGQISAACGGQRPPAARQCAGTAP